MSYEKVYQAKKTIIGTKQTVKAIPKQLVSEVFVALDAETRITEQVILVAQQHDIQIVYVESKVELGKAAGLSVAAAVVALAV